MSPRAGNPGLLLVVALVNVAVLSLVALPRHSRGGSALLRGGTDTLQYTLETRVYQFAIVSDNDARSGASDGRHWTSRFKVGKLLRIGGKWKVKWGMETQLVSKLAEDGRGLELSELVFFNGRLLTCSDRTGVIYQLVHNVTEESAKLVPLFILNDGDGAQPEGFKCEWMTIKDDALYVGSTGKPYMDEKTSAVLNTNRQWVKRIGTSDKIEHVPWAHVYQRIAEATHCEKGYIVHEAVAFNPTTRRWYFLPRKMSKKPWTAAAEELVGASMLISCSEAFDDWTVMRIDLEQGHGREHGFSSFRFLPHRTEMVGLRTVEQGSSVHTDLVVVESTTGRVLLHEDCGPDKYEGLELLPYTFEL